MWLSSGVPSWLTPRYLGGRAVPRRGSGDVAPTSSARRPLVRTERTTRGDPKDPASRIESNGLEQVHEPYIKHLEGPLWEMRMKGRDGIARAAYVSAVGRRVVVVRVFAKKTQKTPRREIELALKRAKEVK
ncbi:MAG: type II toxin-antitoxin system RelE/ParE family toxin [Devosia sp.]|nr:type II toxin-antitoxin system RelE/ParE family toxin [Devosia sp.]